MTPSGTLYGYPGLFALIYGLVSVLLIHPAHAKPDTNPTLNTSISADIVFVIENSGKMQILDPQRVRKAACKRFVSLLDEKDRVAVINFSSITSTEIPFTKIDSQNNISKLYSAIDTPSFSDKKPNWYKALSAARDILDKTPKTQHSDSHIILVSIDPMRLEKSKENQQLNPKIATTLLPWFKAHNVKIHTITFFKNAADPLFTEIAQQTKGRSEFINNVDLLPDVFDKILNSVKPRETLAANTGEFMLDDTTDNFYLVNQPLHGKHKYFSIKLTDPDGSTLTFESHPENMLWTRSKKFETIVTRHAKKGHWTIAHESNKENFSGITLYRTKNPQTLTLQYRFVPNIIHAGEKITVVAWLNKNNAPVTDPEVTNFLKSQLQIFQDNKLEQSISLFPMRTQPGKFSTAFTVKSAGNSQFDFKIYDNNFVRHAQLSIVVQPAEKLPSKQVDTAILSAQTETVTKTRDTSSRLLFTAQEQAMLIVTIVNGVVIIIASFVYVTRRRRNRFFDHLRTSNKDTTPADNGFSFEPTRNLS